MVKTNNVKQGIYQKTFIKIFYVSKKLSSIIVLFKSPIYL